MFQHDTIHNEQHLPNEQHITSPNNQFHLKMQNDGNLVLYKGQKFSAKKALWSSETYGKGSAPFHFKVQNDGNACIYDANGTPTWSSNTYGKGSAPYHFKVQNDGNAVLYDANGSALWASNTYQAEVKIEDTGKSKHNFILKNESYLKSKNGLYFLKIQQDGNLVVYKGELHTHGYGLWATMSHGQGVAPYHLAVQQDGNLVIYDSQGKATWCSNTWNAGQAPYKLICQDDGNVVLYDSNKTAIWLTNTYQG